MKKADVIIIGAGIIGLSVAWQISRRSNQKVLIIEKGAAIGEGSTGASSAVCRHRYSKDEMVFLARDGIKAYRNWARFTGLEQPRAVFQQHGVLWMPGADLNWARTEHERMQTLGIPTEVLDDEELQRRFPAINPCTKSVDMITGEEHGCSGGGEHFLELEGGYIDPVAAAEDLLQSCRGGGVEVSFNTRVKAVSSSGGRVTGVQLVDGSAIEGPVVVNASGPWCNSLIRSLGLDLPWTFTPTRIQVLYLDRPDELRGDIPVCVDMENGIYFRLQNNGQQLVVGSTLEADEQEPVVNPDQFNRFADDEFSQAKLHALHHRFPELPYRGAVRGYCGLYTVNREDMHPVVGETPIEGFILANGFSGHGFKLAPAIGSLVAQLLTGEQADFDTEVPIDFFDLTRELIDPDSKSVLA